MSGQREVEKLRLEPNLAAAEPGSVGGIRHLANGHLEHGRAAAAHIRVALAVAGSSVGRILGCRSGLRGCWR